ncbi:MAG: NAD-dependent epimerase/dehydratase family protein [Anaerolineales bacterium]
MRALVTGGNGFIGAEVVKQLLATDAEVTVFHRSANTARLSDVADRVRFQRGDLGVFSHVLDAVKQARPDTIFHFGAMLSIPSDADPPAAMQANVLGTFHVLEAARLFDVRQVVFASSIGVYGGDIEDDIISDNTLQRPALFYGATKVFGELTGLFYRRKYGLDFRGLRYPSIVGPGVHTPGVVQYTSWVIEECGRGEPFTITVDPSTRVPVLYYKDAARAALQITQPEMEQIKTVNYLVNGVEPMATAGELADLVRTKVPGAQISFDPNRELQPLLDKLLRPLDDSRARAEWGWAPEYDQARMVDDFLREIG